jgi:hypothetical protein
MKIIYGVKGINNQKQIFVDKSDLKIPIGSESYSHAIKLLKQISNKEIFKMFTKEEFSTWWFIYPTIFPSVNIILNFIIQFEKILEKYSPNEVELIGDIEKWEIIEQICQSKNIKISYSNRKLIFFSSKMKIINKSKKYYFSYIFKSKKKKRLEIMKDKEKISKNLNKKIIFATPTEYRRKSSSNDYVKNEYIQGQIMKKLNELNYNIFGIDIDYTFKGETQGLEIRNQDPISWAPLELFLEKNNTIKKSNYSKKFLEIINNEKFQSLFNFRNIKLWKYIENDFKKLSYESHLPFYLEIIETFSQILKNEKPKAIFLPYETGPISLALIIAAKRNKIKTIGIQHGMIYENHPDYSHSTFQNEQNSEGMIIPDKTLLFGDFARNILTNNGFPNENLEILGNPEFFNLDERLESLGKIDLRKKFQVPHNKFVILLTTARAQRHYQNTYGMIDYDEKVWETLIKNLGNNSEFVIILKPHPGENTEIYHKILQKYNFSNCKIISDDLFELISISSIVISIYSTTILDAICCNKPVIRVKFTNTMPTLPYDENFVVQSCNLDQLIENVNEIKNDPKIAKKLLINGKKFAEHQYSMRNNNLPLILKKILES